MKQDLINLENSMQQWYASALGKAVLEQETDRSIQACRHRRAHKLLHIGGRRQQLSALASADTYVKHLSLADLDHAKHPIILPNADQNELRPASFDLIVLNHVIEFYKAPVALLSDCEKLLSADGQIIIYTFNPWSLWGLAHTFNIRCGIPWQSTWHSSSNLQHWLAQLGFCVNNINSFIFRPPIRQAQVYARYAWLDKVGRICWPYCGAICKITAQKVTPAANMEWRKWSQKTTTTEGVTTRSSSL